MENMKNIDVESYGPQSQQLEMDKNGRSRNIKMRMIVQKITIWEGVIIDQVFFSNKNVFGNLMITSCR